MSKQTFFITTVLLFLVSQCMAGPLFGGAKLNVMNKEMVMEHDAILDESDLLPFLTSILNQAGFVEEIRSPKLNQIASSDTDASNATDAMYSFHLPENAHKTIYKAISDCKRLRHSIKEIKPILSFLILGGNREAKLLAKKFSTKLPIKRCRAILTIYCLPSMDLNRRAPRRRLKKILTND